MKKTADELTADELVAPSPVTSAGRGLHVKFAFGADDEDQSEGDQATPGLSPADRIRNRAQTCPMSNGKQAGDRSQELQEYQARVEFLHDVISPLTSLNKYLDTVLMEVKRMVQADKCSIFFVDEVRLELWCIRSLDLEPMSLPWGRGIVGRVAIDGEMKLVTDVHEDPDFDDTMDKRTSYQTKSMLCVPVKHTMDQERTVGVIQAMNKDDGASSFTEDDAMELHKLTLLVRDSFGRHRWNALQEGASHGDAGASSLIAHQKGQLPQQSITSRASSVSGSLLFTAETAESDYSRVSLSVGAAEESVKMFASMRTLEFNALGHSVHDLVQLVPMVMELTGCSEHCGIPDDALQAWSEAVPQHYRDNPFHNWFHGFAAFQMCYYQLYKSDISSQCPVLDVFALLIAALCHDLDHPGFTNSYLIETESVLALRYNDVAVLENQHASLACELLRGERTQICSGLDWPSRRAVRKTMIRCILDTDMTCHAKICKEIVSSNGLSSEAGEAPPADTQQLLLSACLHTSDLSGQVMPWHVAKQWEDRVAREFVNQAAAEIAAGFTPAPFMQFGLDDAKKRGKLQRDFVDFVLVPLWGPYTELVPGSRACYDNLVSNRALWNYRLEHGRDEGEAEIVAEC